MLGPGCGWPLAARLPLRQLRPVTFYIKLFKIEWICKESGQAAPYRSSRLPVQAERRHLGHLLEQIESQINHRTLSMINSPSPPILSLLWMVPRYGFLFFAWGLPWYFSFLWSSILSFSLLVDKFAGNV